MGRFLQPDPVGYGITDGDSGPAQALNVYQYVADDPLNAVDPMGEWFIKAVAALVGIVAIIAFLAWLANKENKRIVCEEQKKKAKERKEEGIKRARERNLPGYLDENGGWTEFGPNKDGSQDIFYPHGKPGGY